METLDVPRSLREDLIFLLLRLEREKKCIRLKVFNVETHTEAPTRLDSHMDGVFV